MSEYATHYRAVPLPVTFGQMEFAERVAWGLGVDAALATYDTDTLQATVALESQRALRQQAEDQLAALRTEHSELIKRCNDTIQQVTGSGHG